MDPSAESGQSAAGGVGGPRVQASGGAQQQPQDQEIPGGGATHHGESLDFFPRTIFQILSIFRNFHY